jgi:outer membrane protein
MFCKYVGAELILATCNNTLWGTGSLSGVKVGSSWLLPPTLLLQWRFFPSAVAQPYIGGGVNYTLFYGVDCSLAGTDLKLQHSWGPAVQGGLDVFFTSNWFINADIKYVWMKTHATLSGAIPGTVTVHINPILFGLGIGRAW